MDGTLSLLVADEHRRRAVEIVTDAYADGRLTSNEEWRRRVNDVAVARTRQDLVDCTEGLGVSYPHLFEDGFVYEEVYRRWLEDAREVLDRTSATRPSRYVFSVSGVCVVFSFIAVIGAAQQSTVLDPYSARELLLFSVALWVILFAASLVMYFRELYRTYGLVSGLSEALTVAVQRTGGR